MMLETRCPKCGSDAVEQTTMGRLFKPLDGRDWTNTATCRKCKWTGKVGEAEQDAGGLCYCRQCLRDRKAVTPGTNLPIEWSQMILCQKCGNKRCPHATDHRQGCTQSNEPGQKGIAYA